MAYEGNLNPKLPFDSGLTDGLSVYARRGAVGAKVLFWNLLALAAFYAAVRYPQAVAILAGATVTTITLCLVLGSELSSAVEGLAGDLFELSGHTEGKKPGRRFDTAVAGVLSALRILLAEFGFYFYALYVVIGAVLEAEPGDRKNVKQALRRR